MATVLLDSYPSSNRNAASTMSATQTAVGQSFMGDGRKLVRAGFFLHKNNSTAGTFTARLYAHTGTYGTSSMGTGAVLATSTNTISYADIANAYEMKYFDFAPITLTAGTPYVIAVQSGGETTALAVGNDTSAPTHGGNSSRISSGTWGALAADLIFEVYVDDGVVAATGRPKIWNGSAWVKKPAKVWNGSAWVEKPIKTWTGSQWKTLS